MTPFQKKSFIFLLTLFLPLAAWGKVSLSLEDYLSQVKNSNLGYQASVLIGDGAKKTSKAANLVTQPTVFTQYQYINDKKPQVFSGAFGDQTIGHSIKAGINEKTPIGLDVTASYQFNDITLNGVNPLFIPNSHYRTASPTVEIKQSLLRNGFGRETRAQKESLRAESMATSFLESFKANQVLIEAKSVYQNLALARASKKIHQQLVAGSQKILSWAKTQADRKLSDESDWLQADASYRLHQLELKAAVDQENILSRQFNTLRGLDADTVSENLMLPNLLKTDYFPDETIERDDMKALRESARASKAQAKLMREAYLPNLDLQAGVALNGLSASSSSTVSDSFQKNPTIMAGMNFSVPLGRAGTVRQGYLMRQNGLAREIRQLQFENVRHYSDLKKRLQEAKLRLNLSKTIEVAQHKKYQFEENKLLEGKSTTFQVLTFHEALGQAELARLQIQSEVYELENQLELYLASKEDRK